MPLLIDGNNLIHALARVGPDLGRGSLSKLLAALAEPGRPGPLAGERVCVVFDGAAPRGPMAEQMKYDRLEAVYSAPRTADELILERIAADTAPRRLTVVSSDRELRRAGRRRRCKLAGSEEFADALVSASARPARPAPDEPPEKRRGCLTPAETQAWMRELGLSEEDADQPQQEP